ncbi:hypothetical protein TRVA0_050S00870 [Trichomonascus vanleenenianus]|uniref:uncharacterized protein n=1 Tax=Trichomonascus vanleenenianus TaxID=2268995 RepID=UPI003EC97523
MSIPTVFTNSNCITDVNLSGGGMAQFCVQFNARNVDQCQITSQEDYDEYQLGCVNYRNGKFVDNNNNTVWLQSKPGYAPVLQSAIEFPVGSHNNLYFVPAPDYVPPYPLFAGPENCLNAQGEADWCCTARPEWSILETVPPAGHCVIMDAASLQSFAQCCTESLGGTFVSPYNGTANSTYTSTTLPATTLL